ncbi:hypothetical protein K491DRAFT_594946 [Lophiostoma macrostomum CBS 122681]|uniref:Ankyrin n=1 Tax=Lophiostoma macrostomum CBS 122681 TaxID=1314788 RepID=A0A6A6TBU1_9PLEO|nr:hypothetical protein K491DRAFT_594946 [Lophiostoma macrostomum CBS 122681]
MGQSIKCSSENILKLIIEKGGRAEDLWTRDIAGTSIPILEILLEHGWNINYRGPHWDPMPFMWHIVEHDDIVAWCLEHGASVFLNKNGYAYHHGACPEILEKAAQYATVSTFELLRSKGAPLGWRPLHLAVEQAVLLSASRVQVEAKGNNEKTNEKRATLARKYSERMAMVRHLIDVIGVDVNALDRPDGRRTQNYVAGNALCYVAQCYGFPDGLNSEELVWFLLDRGADPAAALVEAKGVDNPEFLQDVQAWKENARPSWSKRALRYWPSWLSRQPTTSHDRAADCSEHQEKT